MDTKHLVSIALQAAETFLNDKYSEAIENNDMKEMETLNIRLETLDMVVITLNEVLKLLGDNGDD